MALPPPARGVSYLRSRKSSPTWSSRKTPADPMDKPFGDGSFDGIQPEKKSLGFWCLATQIYPNIRSYLPGISIVLMIFIYSHLVYHSGILWHIDIFDLWFSSFPAWNHLNGELIAAENMTSVDTDHIFHCKKPWGTWHRCTLTHEGSPGSLPSGKRLHSWKDPPCCSWVNHHYKSMAMFQFAFSMAIPGRVSFTKTS